MTTLSEEQLKRKRELEKRLDKINDDLQAEKDKNFSPVHEQELKTKKNLKTDLEKRIETAKQENEKSDQELKKIASRLGGFHNRFSQSTYQSV